MKDFEAEIQATLGGRQVDIEITFPARGRSDADEFLKREFGNDIVIHDLAPCDENGGNLMETSKL